MGKTFVSSCIPVYNGEKYVGETIRSLLAQDYDNYEVVVMDNASTDSTQRIVKDIKDPRLVYRRFEKNVPVQENWSRAFEVAKGEYVAVCHADDTYEPDFISKEAGFLEATPSSAAVFSSANLISSSGKNIGKTSRPSSFSDPEVSADQLADFSIDKGYFPLICPSFMVRKAAAKKCGNFNPSFRFAFDMDYYFRLFDYGKIGFLADYLVNYRQHPMQGSVRLNDTTDTQREFFDILEREIAKYKIQVDARRQSKLLAYKRWGRVIDAVSHAKVGNREEALKLTKESFRVTDALIDFPSLKFFSRTTFSAVFLVSQYLNLGKKFAEAVFWFKQKKRS